ncbi:MAG: glutamine amidotransferase-related protein [Kiloniellales bacterium]
MTKTVVLVNHPLSKRDDRAAALLAARGYRLDWRCPGDGDALPDPKDDAGAAVVYGGPESANDGDSKPYIRAELAWIERWLETGKPYLGLCLGSQMLSKVLGGTVAPHPEGLYEIGYVEAQPTAACNGFMPGAMHVYHWHKEGFTVPASATLLASGSTFPNQAFRYGETAYGLQFHPEVTPAMLRRWVTEAGHMLSNSNAHPAERQLADAARYDAPLAAWLERFLTTWLASGETASSARKTGTRG